MKAIFIPYPMDLLSAVSLLIYREADLWNKDIPVLFYNTWKGSDPKNDEEIEYLFGEKFRNKICAQKMSPSLKRLLNYSKATSTKKGRNRVLKNGGNISLSKMMNNIVARNHDIDIMIDEALKLLEFFKSNDPFHTETDVCPPIQTYPISQRAIFEGKIHLTLPVLKEEDGPGGQDIVESSDKILFEKNALTLKNCPVTLAIVGPPNSGKSSFIASLTREMRNVLESLASRGFPTIRVSGLDLDAGTPTQNVIANGATRSKLKWSWDLTHQTISRAKKDIISTGSDIYLLDCPGKASNFSQALVGLADAAIIVSRHWREIPSVWRPLLKRSGTWEIGHFKSRTSKEFSPSGRGYVSLISKYRPCKLISGRVVGLERVLGYCCDPVIMVGAKILIFDLLPEIINRKQNLLKESSE